MDLKAVEAEYAALCGWLFGQALPLWATCGVDRPTGGFFEKLGSDGVPIDDPRRARVTARQVFVFATAVKLGWKGDLAADMLAYALANLHRHYLKADGIVVPTVDAGGAVLRRDFDLYDHAFVLFALATACDARGGDAALDARAIALRETMTAGWGHPLGGFEESQPRSLPLKANPHMHLLEAALAWEVQSADKGWADMADMIAEMCLARFIDRKTGAQREYFSAEWEMMDSTPEDVVEPGHQFEWAWLLQRWGASRGRRDALVAAKRLAMIGETMGVDATRDLAVNELNADLTLRDGRFRLWPQTERLKAHSIVMATAADGAVRNVAAAQTIRAARGLRRYFDHPVPGSWWEHLGTDGLPYDRAEPARTSSLYHIIGAISEMRVQLDRATEKSGRLSP
jgi:mannose/cellobiose epimerase-like protein (N-acyl-D-glucosamine 2-epimerase family)